MTCWHLHLVVKKKYMAYLRTLHRISALALLAAACGAAQAAPVIDLGAASGYSGFFFGNVAGASDVEGRLAVGGNLSSGFDVGYRNAHGSTGPSLVVQGNISLTSPWGGYSGSVYNGPTYNTNTNATIGPSAAPWIPANKLAAGDIVYGGTLNAKNWQYGNATKNAGYIDFAATKSQLNQLSDGLAAMTQNGSWSAMAGGVSLVGDGVSDLLVFNLGNTALVNLTLSNVKEGAHIVINSTLDDVVFSGGFGGDLGSSSDGLAAYRDRLLFNLSNAVKVSINSFVNGSVLATDAAVAGSGHLEGTLIADSLGPRADGARLEIGYEPYQPFSPNTPTTPATPLPEPHDLALLFAGLLALGVATRQRRISRR